MPIRTKYGSVVAALIVGLIASPALAFPPPGGGGFPGGGGGGNAAGGATNKAGSGNAVGGNTNKGPGGNAAGGATNKGGSSNSVGGNTNKGPGGNAAGGAANTGGGGNTPTGAANKGGSGNAAGGTTNRGTGGNAAGGAANKGGSGNAAGGTTNKGTGGNTAGGTTNKGSGGNAAGGATNKGPGGNAAGGMNNKGGGGNAPGGATNKGAGGNAAGGTTNKGGGGNAAGGVTNKGNGGNTAGGTINKGTSGNATGGATNKGGSGNAAGGTTNKGGSGNAVGGATNKGGSGNAAGGVTNKGTGGNTFGGAVNKGGSGNAASGASGAKLGVGDKIGKGIHSQGTNSAENQLKAQAAFKKFPGLPHPTNANVYHKSMIGNQAIQLAPIGYQPSYLGYSFYNSPWSGQAWGWGWGLGQGYGFGFGGGGWGIGNDWGYGGFSGYGFGPYGYWGRPLGWGFGGWGLGTIAYNSGYCPYYNPYYVVPVNQIIVYNYSNPIPIAAVGDAPLANSDDDAPGPLQAENPAFDAALAAFKVKNYDAALANVDAAIANVPNDSVLHEFRALVLFAKQDYKQAAGVIHSLLAVGPGWDWATMRNLYADPGTYTPQLRALEDYSRTQPKAADAHFLLAYHYTTCNYAEAAGGQLQQVVELMPGDRLAGELLEMIQGPPKPELANAPPAPGTEPTPAEQAADPKPDPIDKDLLPGSWTAARDDGSKFDLRLTDDGQFTWKFSSPGQKEEEFTGTYSIDGPVLVLARKEGGALAGIAKFDGMQKFNFRMVGAPPDDKGLDFGT